MQHWFDNLVVEETGFGITLNFGDSPEPMYIPYDAIRTFVDPSVEFGLRFESHESDEDDCEDVEDAPAPMVEDVEDEHHDAEVVSLDKFRK